MIAIASGLLGSLETAATTAVKKDGGSPGFAAAFEEVSAKHAGTVAQGTRVAGGGDRRGQAGIAGGRSGRTAALSAKAAAAKAIEVVAAEGGAAEVSGGVDGGVVGKSASSTGKDAGRPALAANLNAASLVEAEAAGQELPTGSELRMGGSFVGDEGVSRSVVSGSESASSTVRGSLPGKTAKVPLQSYAASAAPVAKVGGVATSASRIAGPGDAGTAQTQSVDLAATAEIAQAKAVVGAAPDEAATEGITAGQSGSRGVGTRLEDGAAVSAAASTKETEPAAPVTAGVSGQTAGLSKDFGSVVVTKTQGVSGGVRTSTAKTGLQQERETVQVQPTALPVTPAVLVAAQDASGVTVQPSAASTNVVGDKQTLAKPVTVASDGTDHANVQGLASGQVPASENAPVVARSTVALQEITSQEVIAPSAVAGPAIEQQAAKQLSAGRVVVPQQVAAAPEGAAGLVAQNGSSLARVFGGRATTQQTTAEAVGIQQNGAHQVESNQAAPQKIQTQSVGAQTGAEQLSGSEQGVVAQRPDPSVNGATEAVQYAGKPVVAEVHATVQGDKDKHATGVAANASISQKKVGADASYRSTVVNAGDISTAADTPVPPAPVSIPSLSSSPQAVVATAPVAQDVSIAGRANHAARGSDGAKANLAAVPERGASASPMPAGTVAVPVGAPSVATGSESAPERTGDAEQEPTTGDSGIVGVGRAPESLAPAAATLIPEVAGLQAGRVAAGVTAAGGAAASKERRLPAAEGKTAERTPAETTPISQPTPSQHLAGAGQDTAKPSSVSHPSSSGAGTQSVATGTTGTGASSGVVLPSATQVVTHGMVASSMTATTASSGTVQSSTLTSGTGGLASTGATGMESLVSPMAHTTLQATPTVLEVGVPGGTHGWLKIRAEIGDGGTVQASMSAATHEGQETLRRELPAINAFLDSEHVPVSVQVAAHGVSSAAASSVAGGDAGFNLGSSLSQDAGSGRSEAQANLFAGGEGARQGRDEGSQESVRAAIPQGSGRAATPAEAAWVSSSNADPGAGYGSGISANGGSWLNVMA